MNFVSSFPRIMTPSKYPSRFCQIKLLWYKIKNVLNTNHFFNFMSEIPKRRCDAVDLFYYIAGNGVLLLRAGLRATLLANSVYFVHEAAVFECGWFSAGERFFKVSSIRQDVSSSVDTFKNSVQTLLQLKINLYLMSPTLLNSATSH